MKRIVILFVVAVFSAGMIFANEAVLIDFSQLVADIRVRRTPEDQDAAPNQNRRTVMDFGQVAGASFNEAQRSLMRTSLALGNWDIVLNSSARTIQNVGMSYTREAPSQQFGTVMGVRVHFPLIPSFAKATIKPPFEIPAYEPMFDIDDDGNFGEATSNGISNGSRFEEGYGVVRNVGTIRSVAVNVYGLNFPHNLNIILIDNFGDEKLIPMGALNFDGWAELVWNNPQYIFEVRNRDLRLFPLYPHSMPFIKFGGFRLDRDADHIGGDFLVYFKDVKVIYDLAMLEEPRDIDDEELWGIIRDRETSRTLLEMESFGQNQVLRFIESQNQTNAPWDPLHGRGNQERFGFTPTEGNN